MSFLYLPDAAVDMAKATVSFWFRFPESTIDRVNANPPPRNGSFGYGEAATWPVLQWQLTLLSWGGQIDGTIWQDTLQKVGETKDLDNEVQHDNYAPQPTLQQTGPMAPSYIGLHFVEDGDVRLAVNLQGSESASIKNAKFMMTRWDVFFVGTPGVSGLLTEVVVNEDASFSSERPMTIGASSGGNMFPPPVTAVPSIKPDEWHHLLISWDVSGSITCGGDSLEISSDCRMYFALDDENYNEGALPADWIGDIGLEPGAAGTGANTIVSNDAVLHTLPWPHDPGRDEPSYHSNATPAGSYEGSIGSLLATEFYVPGSPNYSDGGRTVNSVYKVEMAELQIFAGLVLDTSDATKRRAFIDFARDESGDPIVDKDGKTTLKPVNPKKTEELLRIRPDILLHGTKNWQKGKNTGSTGFQIGSDEQIEENPAGKFDPTGQILKYTPDPSIEKVPS